MLFRFISLLALMYAASIFSAGTASYAQEAPGPEARPLLAKKSKKKKKKKSDDDETPFGAEGVDAISDNDSGVGIHREQEGVDTPYIAEVAGTTEISSLSSKVEDSEGDPESTLRVAVNGMWLVVLGKIEIGPDLGIEYTKSSQTVTTTSTGANGQPVTSSDTVDVSSLGLSIGPLFKLNLGRIDHDLTVPFVYGGLAYRTSSTEAGESKSESSGFAIRAGGGLNLFVDSNVAFTPSAEFRYETDTVPGDEKKGTKDATTTTTGIRVLLGLGVFI